MKCVYKLTRYGSSIWFHQIKISSKNRLNWQLPWIIGITCFHAYVFLYVQNWPWQRKASIIVPLSSYITGKNLCSLVLKLEVYNFQVFTGTHHTTISFDISSIGIEWNIVLNISIRIHPMYTSSELNFTQRMYSEEVIDCFCLENCSGWKWSFWLSIGLYSSTKSCVYLWFQVHITIVIFTSL